MVYCSDFIIKKRAKIIIGGCGVGSSHKLALPQQQPFPAALGFGLLMGLTPPPPAGL
jgi:hypothetical protein